jgi:hypothetical protein
MDGLRTRPQDLGGTEEYGMGLTAARYGCTYIGYDGALPGAASVMKYLRTWVCTWVR